LLSGIYVSSCRYFGLSFLSILKLQA